MSYQSLSRVIIIESQLDIFVHNFFYVITYYVQGPISPMQLSVCPDRQSAIQLLDTYTTPPFSTCSHLN